jgi:hypothetical protein
VDIKEHHIRPGLQDHDDGSVGIGGLATTATERPISALTPVRNMA